MSEQQRQAHAAHRDGIPGYYVVNRATDIAVAGPFERWDDAREEASRVNAIEPRVEQHPCEVRLVGESRVRGF